MNKYFKELKAKFTELTEKEKARVDLFLHLKDQYSTVEQLIQMIQEHDGAEEHLQNELQRCERRRASSYALTAKITSDDDVTDETEKALTDRGFYDSLQQNAKQHRSNSREHEYKANHNVPRVQNVSKLSISTHSHDTHSQGNFCNY